MFISNGAEIVLCDSILQAYCQHLEEQLSDVKQKVQELVAELNATKSQLAHARVQQEALVSALHAERGLRDGKSSTKQLGDADNVEALLTESEISWRCHGYSLRGKMAHVMPSYLQTDKEAVNTKTTSPLEKGNSWERRLEIAVQSSGLDRRRPSKLSRRCSSEPKNPRTSTPVKREGDGQDSSHRASISKSIEGLAPRDEGREPCGSNGKYQTGNKKSALTPVRDEAALTEESNRRDSGIISDTSSI